MATATLRSIQDNRVIRGSPSGWVAGNRRLPTHGCSAHQVETWFSSFAADPLRIRVSMPQARAQPRMNLPTDIVH